MQEVLGCFQERLENSEESLEDLAGEEVKRNVNLNTTSYVGRDMFIKSHQYFHFRGKTKIRGKKEDTQECRECKKILSLMAFTTKYLRADGAWVLKKHCRECETNLSGERRKIKKNALPQPEKCDCCHTKKPLTMDHIHRTLKFRGWLCNNCNVGIGHVGDTLKGILQAAIYLEKNIDKIIETLNEIKNEME